MSTGLDKSNDFALDTHSRHAARKEDLKQRLAILERRFEQLLEDKNGSKRPEHGGKRPVPQSLTLDSEASEPRSPRMCAVSPMSRRPGSVTCKLTPADIPKLIFISDPGQDLDDEVTFIMCRHLVEQRLADVLGIIATLSPAFDRARLCQGTLAALGLSGVPVGLGSDGGDMNGAHVASTFEKWAALYMPPYHSSVFEPARLLLRRLYDGADPKSLSLVIIASLKDAALFLREEERLFVSKTREVVIMGGVEPLGEDASVEGEITLVPDTAHNQMFDRAATVYFYERCQELGIPLIIVSRWAAYAAKTSRSLYDELAQTGSWIGCRLRNAQRASIETLWNRACGEGDEREQLPDRCDRDWFLKTFCNGALARGRKRGDTIWDLVSGFMQYDTVATLAAIPRLRDRFFTSTVVNGLRGAQHLIIGSSETQHGVANPTDLQDFLYEGLFDGLTLNNQSRTQFIFISQHRLNNNCDDLLAIVVLRALFELGNIDCVGIIISPGAEESHIEEQTLQDQASAVVDMLNLLGLEHVPVLLADSYKKVEGKKCGADHLAELYKTSVSPAGVSLVITGTLGEVADFAEAHSAEFTQKTQCVIFNGGAIPSTECDAIGTCTGETVLKPDEDAQNIKSDLRAANRFMKLSQELLVPLIIISRHCSSALQLPRKLFDDLADEGGPVGRKLREIQKECIMNLWNAVRDSKSTRGKSLPSRCDSTWFCNKFCEGQLPECQNGSDVWDKVQKLNVYSLLSVLSAFPPFFKKYMRGNHAKVRSVSHVIIGVSKEDHGVIDVEAARELIYRYLSSGCLLNQSIFDVRTHHIMSLLRQ